MSALHRCPCFSLTFLLFLRVRRLVTDCRRINQQFCSTQSHESSTLRVPLVPTHLHTQAPHRCMDRLETQITWSEIEFLVIRRVVRNMHLAIFACNRTILLKHHRRIVIQASGTTLKKRGDKNDGQFLGKFSIKLGGRSRDRLSQIEAIRRFHLAEIQ